MMQNDVIIREDIAAHMAALKQWLLETKDEPLETMEGFFAARLGGYEAHMSVWAGAYRQLAAVFPGDAHTLLDLGCGTGLELDEILRLNPALAVTGIDLSAAMLARLREKHPGVKTIEADYFTYSFEPEAYDAAVSFESLHHFPRETKRGLYQKVWTALAPGGIFFLVDYLACCDEEEELLANTAAKKRARSGIPEKIFVHFDTPLTPAHEMEALRGAGFSRVALTGCIEGACFIRAEK